MTEQLMSVPAVGNASDGSVRQARRAATAAAINRTGNGERGGSIILVLLAATILVAAMATILMLGGSNTEPYILAFLAVLAAIGVFSVFAMAGGLLRLRTAASGNPLLKAVVDSAPGAIVVTDGEGRLV